MGQCVVRHLFYVSAAVLFVFNVVVEVLVPAELSHGAKAEEGVENSFEAAVVDVFVVKPRLLVDVVHFGELLKAAL